ncbi:ATP-dependent DNA helicase RecG [Alphaproteobacteria bacterium]|nr:ATP-dependent DNA helicase RecG [Alphaproteobacteria bacterium]
MRPEKINKIYSSISTLPGVGPKIESLFNRMGIYRNLHFLWHIPYNIIKRQQHSNIHNAEIKSLVTLKIRVLDHKPSKFRRQPYRVNCICDDTPLDIVYFNARHPVVRAILPIGKERYISGKLEFYKNTFQITHPSHIVDYKELKNLKDIEPIYSITSGLSHKIVLKYIDHIINLLPNFNEWIDQNIIDKYSFQSWNQSIRSIHNPSNSEDLINNNIYRRRLAYDELLAHQLAISIIRNTNYKKKGIKFISNSNLINDFIDNLPFKLTNSQKESWLNIKKDLQSNNQMVRLLQGDVGSGKTIVALISMLFAVESGYQAAIMVPTSILAHQHYENIQKLLEKISVKIILLTGKDKGRIRLEKTSMINSGEAKIIVGTHALIQDDIKFKSIGLIVIDEQHRFGVFQRMAFSYKGLKPSVLVMSATPIPRTLTLAAYGDMDESKITEKPLGRLPIITTSLKISMEEKLIERLKHKLKSDEKVYWVCPLVEESEELDLKAATIRFETLNKIFKNDVLLIHGRLKEKEKEEIMNKFQNINYKILVSTTVIEVGIDIKEATTIIIEHAERFGLAQLHQLRGRVGRNDLQSSCILLHTDKLGENAKRRINKMKETNDGFKIAEEDLAIRGPGEVLGRKQSGIPSFKLADLSFDSDLLEDVRINALEIISKNPKLLNSQGDNLKNLLYLFERDVAIKTLMAG